MCRSFRSISSILFLAALVWGGAVPGALGAPENAAIAASIAPAFETLARAFEAQGHGAVTIVAGASGKLAQQIEQGAPYPLFVSANEKWASYLEDKGMLREKRPVAQSALVLWWPQDTPPSLDLLKDPKSRVAMANPDVAPLGVAARDYLQSEKLYDVIEKERRLVLTSDILGVALAVKSHGADLGFLAQGTAKKLGGSWTPLPGKPQQYVGGLTAPESSEVIRDFWSFVTGPEGGRILEEEGFEVVKP
ncbi:MAG TPA: molybdate ABC transporter substrate-binding protein [Synergistaceae bacterium]|nr:molybdate ABC transporter substrate-binding protein [Synergistaceae bacterium]